MTKTLFNVVEYKTQELCKVLENSFKREYPQSDSSVSFVIKKGRKYLKILQVDNSDAGASESVHAFVDKVTGDLYKPASFKAPADIVRFNILDDADWRRVQYTADWAGGYLYLR